MAEDKVDFAFRYLRSKYGVWWARRVATPELLAAERLRWARSLESYSFRQVRDAALVMRRDYRFRPPSDREFARLMDLRAGRPVDRVTGRRFDAPVQGDGSRRFFSDVRQVLGG